MNGKPKTQRSVSIVWLLAAGIAIAVPRATHAQARKVLIERFTRDSDTALCVAVVPSATVGKLSTICYYKIGEEISRDDDQTTTIPRTPSGSDKGFDDWLKASLGDTENCNFKVFTGNSLPLPETLKESCQMAQVGTSQPTEASSDLSFQQTVRNEMDKKVSALNSTSLVGIKTGSVPNGGGGVDKDKVAEELKWTKEVLTNTRAKLTKKEEELKSTRRELAKLKPPDWLLRALPLLILLLVAALVLERLWSLAEWKRYLRTQLAQHDEKWPAQAIGIKDARSFDAAVCRVLSLRMTQIEQLKSQVDDKEKVLQKISAALEGPAEAVDVVAAVAQIEDLRERARSIEEWAIGLAGPSATETVPADSGAAMKSIEAKLDELRELNDFVKRFATPFWENAPDRVTASVVITEIETSLHEIHQKHAKGPSGEGRAMLASLRETIESLDHELADERQRGERAKPVLAAAEALTGVGESALDALERQTREISEFNAFLDDQLKPIPSADLTSKLTDLKSKLSAARSKVSAVGCDNTIAVDRMLTELVLAVQYERDSAQTSHRVVSHARQYLALTAKVDPADLEQILVRELDVPQQRILRLCLTATLPAMQGIVDRLGTSEADVLRLLHVEELSTWLAAFRDRLQSLTGEQLWPLGIWEGFAQNPLHWLFRAEVIVETYFEEDTFSELADVLTVIAWAFRHAITASGHQVDAVQLLGPRPSDSEKVPVDSDLQKTPQIHRRVVDTLKTSGEGFVVDVPFFTIRDAHGEKLHSGSVALAKRFDWGTS